MFHPSLKKISEFLDNALSEAERENVKDHLQTCEKCRKRMKIFMGVEKIASKEETVSAGFTDKIMNTLPNVEYKTEPVFGRVTGIAGAVLISRKEGEEPIQAFPGIAIKKGDTVRVQKGSVALVEMNDKSQVYLNKDTEIEIPKTRFDLRLRLGEIFAMMNPQKSVFRIKTPSALIGVIGTDFDTRITKEKNTVLRVLKGKVSFQNDKGEVLVKKNRQVETPQGMRPKISKIADPASVGDWRNKIISEKRGSAAKNLVWAIVLIGIAIGAVLYFRGALKPGSAPDKQKPIILDKKDPLAIESPYFKKDFSWKVHARGDQKAGNEWKEVYTMVVRMDVLRYDEQKGADLLMTIEEVREGKENQDVAKSMIGKKFSYSLSSEGEAFSLSSFDGKPLKGMEIVYFLRVFGLCEFSNVFMKKSIVPGDTWQDQINVSIPGFPESYVKGDIDFAFAGYQKRAGKEVGVIKSVTKFNIGGGFAIEKVINANNTVRVEFENITLDGQGEFIFDIDTHRLIKANGVNREYDMRGTEILFVKGRKSPLRKPMDAKRSTLSRTMVSIEYLDDRR